LNLNSLRVVAHNDVKVGPATILEQMLNPRRKSLPVKPADECQLNGQVRIRSLRAIGISAKRA